MIISLQILCLCPLLAQRNKVLSLDIFTQITNILSVMNREETSQNFFMWVESCCKAFKWKGLCEMCIRRIKKHTRHLFTQRKKNIGQEEKEHIWI